MANTYYFRDTNGKISQINNVVGIAIASPLIAHGTYRDQPPPVPSGGALVITVTDGAGGYTTSSAQFSGGVESAITGSTSATINAKSSIEEDDSYNHVDLRYIYAPMRMVFFLTEAGVTRGLTLPDSTTFSVDRPTVGGHFPAFEVDCLFSWDENCGIFNTPPQGWTPGETV